jgi:peroxiredoxin
MTIKIGDRLPSVKLKHLGADGMKDVATDELFAGKKAVLFAVPGAFTPTCSAKHVPSFVGHYDALKAKGVELVACVSVNDAFVMAAWGKDQHADGKVMMLADGNGELTKAIGLSGDMSAYGLGLRSQRYAMVLDDGVVTVLNVEQPGSYEVSSAEAVLQAL